MYMMWCCTCLSRTLKLVNCCKPVQLLLRQNVQLKTNFCWPSHSDRLFRFISIFYTYKMMFGCWNLTFQAAVTTSLFLLQFESHLEPCSGFLKFAPRVCFCFLPDELPVLLLYLLINQLSVTFDSCENGGQTCFFYGNLADGNLAYRHKQHWSHQERRTL